MSQHIKRVVILFSLLVSISLLTINSYGQGGSAEKPSTPPSTKQQPKSSQPAKRSTTSSRGSRSASSNSNTSSTSSASPALEETLKFIQDTVDAHSAKLLTSFSRLSGCEVRITIDVSSIATTGDYVKYTFSLTDMNPQSIEISENQAKDVYSINVKTTGSKGNVKNEDMTLGKYHVLLDGHGAALVVSNKESATSISNALSHAIKLCGGKPDPF